MDWSDMGDSEASDRIDRMKEMDSGPGVDEVIEVYDGESGYSQDEASSRTYPEESDTVSYSDSSD